jgi:hypothetical protein
MLWARDACRSRALSAPTRHCYDSARQSPNGIAEVELKSGKWKLIANLGIAYLATHPAKFESADDFEPDGTYYNMIAVHGRLVTVEPNHGNMLAVSPSGRIETLLDISASQGHIVPTSLAEQDAAGFPTPGVGKVVRVKHSGEIEDVITGLTVPTAMTFGPNGHLYVSNLGAAPAGAGQILKFAITPGW